jgi:hypothetical protein
MFILTDFLMRTLWRNINQVCAPFAKRMFMQVYTHTLHNKHTYIYIRDYLSIDEFEYLLRCVGTDVI